MTERPDTDWPAIDSAYTDEYGQIQVEVYMTAGAIWDAARRFALLTLQDSHAGSRLLFRAAVIVSLKMSEPNGQIENLKAYLFQTYKHLVLDELRKENRRKELQAERRAELDSLSITITDDVDRKILLEQTVRRMDPWLRRVYELRCLGYDFDAIARSLSEKPNVVRSRYSKRVADLINKMKEEARQAAEQSSKKRFLTFSD